MSAQNFLKPLPVITIPSIAGIAPIPRQLLAGDALFHRGDKTFGIFYVAAGRLRMQRVTPDGGTVTLHVARPGEMFAEASLFAEHYQCDVIAETDSEVWTYAKDKLHQSLCDNPECLWAFTAGLARDLHRLRLRYELKQIRSAPDRVLQLLRLQCDGNGVYRSTGTLKELSAELGLTHEALYRALATLERQKHISRNDGLITVLPMNSDKS
jgi:CRP/FNR family transcriptional regulator, dissimilatory nitrate respiration regulator